MSHPQKDFSASPTSVFFKQSNRFEIIDLLRALAILLVVIRHVQLRIPFETTQLMMSLPEQIFNALFVSGSEGVRIFFVISGFIITTTALKRYSDLQYIDIKQFYRYRFARIAPPLIALLMVLTALHFWGVKDYVIKSKFTYFEALFSALTFHLNWLEGTKGYLPGSWDVLWSLSVEEVFYLAFPIVCLMSRRKSIIYIVLFALIVIGPFYRYSLEGDKIWQAKAYLSCMDSIALGCLFALLSYNKTLSALTKNVFSIIGCVIVMFVLAVKRETAFDFIGDLYLFKTLLSIGIGLLLIASVRQQLTPLFSKLLSPLIIYGRLSYEVYLTHMFVVYSAIRLYKKYNVSLDYSFIWLIGIILVSGLLAYVVERYFSKPMNMWIRQNGNNEKRLNVN